MNTEMLEHPPFDPRAIANLFLDIAADHGLEIRHLELQKLIYFAHGLSLRGGTPLITGGFEAWKHGPVQPAVYKSFEECGRGVIKKRAIRVNIITGVSSPIPAPMEPSVNALIERVLVQLGRLGAFRLVDLSHSKDGPWDFIKNKANTGVALGMRIPDNIILERFVNHKMAVSEKYVIGGELDVEDAPLAGNGPS